MDFFALPYYALNGYLPALVDQLDEGQPSVLLDGVLPFLQHKRFAGVVNHSAQPFGTQSVNR